jgi:hypothetical protein
MKYFKHLLTEDGVQQVRFYKPEGKNTFIPPEAEDNMDYARMMEGVNADPPTNTIEEVDDTPE